MRARTKKVLRWLSTNWDERRTNRSHLQLNCHRRPFRFFFSCVRLVCQCVDQWLFCLFVFFLLSIRFSTEIRCLSLFELTFLECSNHMQHIKFPNVLFNWTWRLKKPKGTHTVAPIETVEPFEEWERERQKCAYRKSRWKNVSYWPLVLPLW